MITYKNVHRNIFIVAKDQNPIKQRSTYLNKVDLFQQRGNKKWTIQRSWQHRAHVEKNNTKAQHNTYWTPLYGNKRK
jgi:hypothetical protein